MPINSNGVVVCGKCGKKHALKLEGKDFVMEWYCPRCHHFNIERMVIGWVPTWLQEWEKEQPLDNKNSI